MTEIEKALNKFENAYRVALKLDFAAEQAETWEAAKLKRCEDAWAMSNEAKAELRKLIGRQEEALATCRELRDYDRKEIATLREQLIKEECR